MREPGIYQLGTMRGNKLGDAKPLVFKKFARDVGRDVAALESLGVQMA
jgi:hypothetical protein